MNRPRSKFAATFCADEVTIPALAVAGVGLHRVLYDERRASFAVESPAGRLSSVAHGKKGGGITDVRSNRGSP